MIILHKELRESRIKGKGKHASSTENRRMVWEKIIWPLVLDVNRSYFSLKEYHVKNEVTQNDSVVTSLNDEITSVNSRKEDLTDTKKVLVSHISMPFENLRRDMAAVFQITKGIGNVFFKVSVDIGTRLVEIEFCGITQDNTMTSTSKGKLKEAGTNFPLGS